MNRSARTLTWLLLTAVWLTAGCSTINSYQRKGELDLPGLREKVEVLRDEKGMAYIHASSLDDAIMAQGFVMAQDRLFQMELMRLFASGRISELAGESGRSIDIRMRTLGFLRNARKHAAILAPAPRHFMERYIAGVNAYIRTRQKTFPIEFRLAGLTPERWKVEDSLAIMYYMAWNSAANLRTEIIAQMLVEKLGPKKASEIFPLNINPDDPSPVLIAGQSSAAGRAMGLNLASDPVLMGFFNASDIGFSSNNWALGPTLTGGAPVLASDPHLDARMLPGPWYPFGLIIPGLRAVGVTVPGTPGMVIGRNQHVAFGLTNAYADAQDLYVETIDPDNPDHYLEGERSFPFTVIEETIRIRDKAETSGFRSEIIQIRLTGRGPVITDIYPGLDTEKVLSVRWAPFETMGPEVGFDRLLTATSVADIRDGLRYVNWIMLNFVFADTGGNIGWHVSGKIPVRQNGDGTVPLEVTDSRDNWVNWIPFEKMPHSTNPGRGWLGTCNHLTVNRDYPYYYTSYVSPSYRYRRLIQLIQSPGSKRVDDCWKWQRDTRNLMAEVIAPRMAAALAAHPETAEMGRLLSEWDFHDDPDQAAPTVFQAVYRRFAMRVYADELGPELAGSMLNTWYFWQERLQQMLLDGYSPWFDDISTPDVQETADMLFYKAGLDVMEDLSKTMGKNPEAWEWGRVHRVEFISPMARKGFLKKFFWGGSHAASGSGETLYRNLYDFQKPFNSRVMASLRMVVDLDDDEKVLAVLPGGVTARILVPHTGDQIDPYMNGEKKYWWFSEQAIREHAENRLLLVP